jgi:adsorption protein B
MPALLPDWLIPVDQVLLFLVAPLALLLVLSGLDDLGVDLAWLYAWVEYRLTCKSTDIAHNLNIPQSSIAIMVPLWHEHQVIARMLEHNVASIRYKAYHFFVGVYPNDELTKNAVGAMARRFPNVHMAVCPHDGPTSKADCLNWVYQHIRLYEEENDEHFDIIVTHDAEDMVHPEELHWINYYATRYDFVQIPVFGLKTPFRELTHGVYCDEFAENHSRDMVVRSRFRCFVPGAGVGTGYRREALEKLASAQSNRIFEPAALTEDYENGLRLRRLGCSQVFASPWRTGGPGSDFVATREYFPQKWSAALRQRSRWVTGISLQGWERFGWEGTLGEVYWLWRDRKGLLGSPLGVAANALFAYGLATHMWTRLTPNEVHLTWATLTLQVLRTAIRMGCVARIYGFAFSLAVPLRVFYANALNAAATFSAVARYAKSKWRGEPLRWLKTEHAYPSRAALLGHKRRLGEILTGSGYLSEAALQLAIHTLPAHTRIGEHLIALGEISENVLYEALSLQQGLPFTSLDREDIPLNVARAIPKPILREWRVLPFKIAEDGLSVASPDLPTPQLSQVLQNHTSLEIHFHLVMPREYEQLSLALL